MRTTARHRCLLAVAAGVVALTACTSAGTSSGTSADTSAEVPTSAASSRSAPPAPVSTSAPTIRTSARSTTSAPHEPAIDRQSVDAAARYAQAQGLSAGVSVRDLETGTTWSAGAADRRFPTASVVKTMIATRLLVEGRMSGAVERRAKVMITRSDNDAAWALYPLVGRDGLEPWIAEHYGLRDLGAPPTMPGIWGSTQVTATGLVGFYAAVRKDRRVWPWLSAAMHAHEAKNPAGEPNDFGVAAAFDDAAVKNGWATNRDPQHPENAIVDSTGFVLDDRYAVAILTEGGPSFYYAKGERIVSRAAARLRAH